MVSRATKSYRSRKCPRWCSGAWPKIWPSQSDGHACFPRRAASSRALSCALVALCGPPCTLKQKLGLFSACLFFARGGTWSQGSPQSSERLARHARARIPNDVRVREADYFDGSRAPESQGQKGSELATTENPKGEQTKPYCQKSLRSARCPFCRNLDQRDQSASETDEHSCHFKPNE